MITPVSKPKSVCQTHDERQQIQRTPLSRIWQEQPYRLCGGGPSHLPFHYWRESVGASVCDVCNWSTAYAGRSPGGLWQYPVEHRALLAEALAKLGITPEAAEAIIIP